MFKKLLLCAVLGFSFQSLLPIKIQTGDGVEFPLTPFQKETLNSVAINNAPAGFADKDTRRFDFLDQDTFKLLLELIGPGDVFNVDRAKEILCGTSPAEFLPLLMGCSYLMVCNAALLEIIAKHYFAIQRDISWYDFVEHAQYITAFFQQDVAQKELSNASTQTLTVGSWVESVAFSPDGTKLETGSNDHTASDDHTARLWDINTGQCLQTFTGHADKIISVAFSPDGTKLATGSDDRTARLWDINTGQCIQTLTGHVSYVLSVTFSPDGNKLATGSLDKTAKLWDVNTGQCIQTFTDHTGPVLSVTFSPDGNKLAPGSSDHTASDHKASLWDVNTGQCLQTFTGHKGWVRSVAFSPDGTKMATVSDDRTARLLAIDLNEWQQVFLVWAMKNPGRLRLEISPFSDEVCALLLEQLQRKSSTRTRSACSVM